METVSLSTTFPFITKDGSEIRELLAYRNSSIRNQSLAEARVPSGGATERHYHRLSEEFYFILEGTGVMEIDGHQREIIPGDAVLIPAGSWHQITARNSLRFLCCCAPPYSHDDTYFK